MATRTSSKAAAGVQPRGLTVGTNTEIASYSVGAGTSLSAGDVIQMIKVPKGARVTYMALSGGSGDALIAAGDGVDTDRYIAAVTMSSAQPGVRVLSGTGTPYTYSVDDTLDILVGTVSIGSITGGFTMVASWTMDT